MSENLLVEIDAKIETLIRIQALLSVQNMDKQKDRILFLNSAGIRPKDIASILGTTPNTVNVAIARDKKAGSKASGKA